MITRYNFGILIACICFSIGLNSCTRETVPKSALVSWTEEAKKNVPGALKERFVKYWESRAKFDWDKTYEIEAPHERWLYNRKVYAKRHRMAGRPEKIVVQKMIIHNKDAVELVMELKLEDARTMEIETFYPRDYWIRVGGVWYHVEKSPLQRFL